MILFFPLLKTKIPLHKQAQNNCETLFASKVQRFFLISLDKTIHLMLICLSTNSVLFLYKVNIYLNGYKTVKANHSRHCAFESSNGAGEGGEERGDSDGVTSNTNKDSLR